MSSGHQHGPPDTSKGYEQSDLSFEGITRGVMIYFIFTALIGVVVYIGFLLLHQTVPNTGPFNQFPADPYPLLQNNITDRTDIWNLRTKEDYLLHNTTFVDKKAGIVRIPIDEALDQVASQGPMSLATAPTGPTEGAKVVSPSGLPEPPVTHSRAPRNEFAGEKTPLRKRVAMPPPLQGTLRIPKGAGRP